MAETARWYVVQTYSGYEQQVSKSIMIARDNRQMQDIILETNIPMETVTEKNEKGEEHEYQRKKMPGYVFVKMIMTDEARQLVRNVNGCAGFLTMPEAQEGSREMVPVPQALTQEEVQRMGVEVREVVMPVRVGDRVRINEGAMEGWFGTVESVDESKWQVNISVMMFGGRETPLTMGINGVSVIEDD